MKASEAIRMSDKGKINFSSAEHLAKQVSSTASRFILIDKSMLFSDEQPLNKESSKILTPDGIVIVVRAEHSVKTPIPKVTMVSGSEIEVSDLQF